MIKNLNKLLTFVSLLSFGIFFSQSDLQVTKTVSPTSAEVGTPVTFTITATNAGSANNTNVRVDDLLPTGFQYLSHTVSSGTYNVGTGVWNIGPLNNVTTRTLTIDATLKSTGNYTNTATISTTSGIPDPISSNNSASATVAVICTEQVQGQNFSTSNGASTTFNQPATNNGFVFDIFTLDNSFNLTINGTQLATTEIQFQSGSTPPINIKFTDGTLYEINPVGPIFQLTGTAAAPIIRVVISSTGAVKLFGSKVSGGPLFPLELFNGNALNTITWNSFGTNTVTASQLVIGPTTILGTGYGSNIIPCVCYNDPNLNGGTAVPSNHGITLLKRAGANNGNWPMARSSAFTVLESNTKGFVVTRLSTVEIEGQTTPTVIAAKIVKPQDGMMVYDTSAKCLKIYTVDEVTPANSAWKCYTEPACP